MSASIDFVFRFLRRQESRLVAIIRGEKLLWNKIRWNIKIINIKRKERRLGWNRDRVELSWFALIKSLLYSFV